MKDSSYHKILRIGALVFAFVLIFDSGVLAQSTAQLSNGAQTYLSAAVGVGAGVKPTELNTLTAQITTRQTELDAREAAIEQREISVGLNQGGVTESDYSTYVLSSILFILLVLILLNYTLDYIRSKEKAEYQTSQISESPQTV